ncbi:MAG TPA: response regulator [Caulobacteraceae bacterium]|nr:response regulator [Caulobacteraceae bacterium]
MATPTVLIADDDAVSMYLLRHCLTTAGFRVCCAQDGREALQLMATESPALVILDVMMPVMDGLEVLRHAKASESLAAIPVIVVTSREQDSDILDAVKLGAADYLVKPFMPTELLSRVARIIVEQRRAA